MATRDPTAERIDSTHMDRLKKAVQWTFPYMTRAEEFPYDDVDVNRGNKGDMWQRCIEQAVITIATWNGSTFADDARAAVRAQRDAYCIEPDSYGAPVVLVMEAAYDEFGDSNCF
ncbi:hypothetical protein SARC_01945 [Sphaeroforma arctica JP610]|uniref:Uncharacterized protein n=1 Tax=Sphaeroforma arctica JP610 TaxID=667725 RepID=A0A0L0GA44_9EUKA|nr:hypothetical protein SARC_01945 [Sphaeroforma arctica JP610]KNC85907.1 hypothetical protein SARC_01945 [Sphaeroforma arctica JP610]|eukprot:XP_014159809.1 hypothetical protein SARC_01945 [Sphaeroforma arctica JP610]